jgi:NAD(P)H-hydrate epimerase
VLAEIAPQTVRNTPALWREALPRPHLDAHKYTRGHAIVVSGPPDSTGAARLGARGALRVGAGLVTLVGSAAATAVNATQVTAVMVKALASETELGALLTDERRNAVLIGPGAGVGAATVEGVLAVLASPAAAVLDADALTSFAPGESEAPVKASGLGFVVRGSEPGPGPEALFEAVKARQAAVVLTPHEGEFRRLFGGVAGSKLERAREAARLSGAVVILKGPDTVIAAPDGRAAINDNAPPWLATAGSGDVLAGFVTGLLAQKMPAFEAACAAVWLHGACATAFGPGLIAEDLPEALPRVLAKLDGSA